MKSLIIISLFLLISSKLEEIEFGKDLLFENGKSFSFTAEKDGYVFIKILYDGPNRVNYTQQIGGIQSKGFFSEPGISEISKISKGSLFKITFNLEPNEKGKFWINPSWNELKVDLNRTYEWPIEYGSISKLETSLTYTVDNAVQKAKFDFTYEKKSRKLPNPFRVCHGQDCKDNVVTYDIEKGQSYKIYIKVVPEKGELFDMYYFPTFKFIGNGIPSPEPEPKPSPTTTPSNSFNLRSNLWALLLLLLFLSI